LAFTAGVGGEKRVGRRNDSTDDDDDVFLARERRIDRIDLKNDVGDRRARVAAADRTRRTRRGVIRSARVPVMVADACGGVCVPRAARSDDETTPPRSRKRRGCRERGAVRSKKQNSSSLNRVKGCSRCTARAR
jgi:hypothetical protein